jgi:two-component response regulator (ARR-A family)
LLTCKSLVGYEYSGERLIARITRCMEEGAEDFLLKPVRPSDVSRLCSRMIR